MMDRSGFQSRQVKADLESVPGCGDVAGPFETIFRQSSPARRIWAALAPVLADAVGAGTADPVIPDIWRPHRAQVRQAPAPIRAALMNGIKTLRDLGLAAEIDPPAPADLVTLPVQRVAAALIGIGRQMTADEMDHVARADHGCDVARHRAALAALLDDPAIAYAEGEVWYPAEVIELLSHVPGKPGHVPCLAIVLLDALRSGDRSGNAEFRFEQQHSDLAGLAPKLRDPFLAAVRHLYESVPHWAPSIPAPVTLPWVALPET